MKVTQYISSIAVLCLSLCACGGGGEDGTPGYTVNATAGTGGTISPGSATVSEGSTTSFKVTPDTGYTIDTVFGCGGSLSGNTYTTGAVTADCTVTASFVADPVYFTSGQNASVVIGQTDFTTKSCGTSQSLICGPWANPDVINGVLYLGDYGGSRVLGFNTIPTANGANADFVLGATDFTSAGSLNSAETVADYNGALYVLENGNTDVAVYNTIPTAATTVPSATTPQTPDFTLTAGSVGGLNCPEAMAVAGGKLVVADSGNNRVLIWNTVPTSDTAPDLVLGQADFSGTDVNAGVSPTASTLSYPAGIWTDGTRLVVVEDDNNRVLIWNNFPTSNAQPADRVIGQPDFNSSTYNQGLSAPTASTLGRPHGVYVLGNQLFVSDASNRRVLIWNSWPSVDDQAADVVLGQADFTTVVSGPTQSIMDMPTGLYLSGTQLIVGDATNYRYLVFDGHY